MLYILYYTKNAKKSKAKTCSSYVKSIYAAAKVSYWIILIELNWGK